MYIINISAICTIVPCWQLTKILNQAHLILWHIWSDTNLKSILKGLWVPFINAFISLAFSYFLNMNTDNNDNKST